MAASGKKLESKEPIPDVMPSALSTMLPSDFGIQKHIYEYYFNPSQELLKTPFTMFGISSLREQILALTHHAGPLDQVEAYIRQAHARRESHLPATLMQATIIAAIGLDQTIRKESGTEIEGMAERLLKLHEELLPDTYPQTLEQARLAAPLEDAKEQKTREDTNIVALNTVFNAFVQNDAAKIAAAIESFKEFVISSKPVVMTNNRYHLNLIHLVCGAFDVLARRGGDLPRIGAEQYHRWYGKLADRFCFEIIGAAIEMGLPARPRQILEASLYDVLTGSARATRVVDIDGARFRGAVGTEREVGVNSYYDARGRRGGGEASRRLLAVGLPTRGAGPVGRPVFKTYYEQLHQHPKFIIQRPRTHSSSRCLIM